MTRNVRKVFPMVLPLLGLLSPMHVSSRAMDCILPEVRAYIEANRATMKIVATTVTRRGQILDWIDPHSQVPDGDVPFPPPLATEPDPPNPGDPDQPKQARGELEDEPEARGPPGTVPILRPNLRYACGLTLEEWLDGPNSHGGMRSDSP